MPVRVALRVGVMLIEGVLLVDLVAELLGLAPKEREAVGLGVPVREREFGGDLVGVPVPVLELERDLVGVLEGVLPLLREAVGVREVVLVAENFPGVSGAPPAAPGAEEGGPPPPPPMAPGPLLPLGP